MSVHCNICHVVVSDRCRIAFCGNIQIKFVICDSSWAQVERDLRIGGRVGRAQLPCLGRSVVRNKRGRGTDIDCPDTGSRTRNRGCVCVPSGCNGCPRRLGFIPNVSFCSHRAGVACKCSGNSLCCSSNNVRLRNSITSESDGVRLAPAFCNPKDSELVCCCRPRPWIFNDSLDPSSSCYLSWSCPRSLINGE